jgi:hypothetical protein
MQPEDTDAKYIRVKDLAGNSFICPLSSLKDPAHVSDEEIYDCVDDATVGRYAGNIKVEE